MGWEVGEGGCAAGAAQCLPASAGLAGLAGKFIGNRLPERMKTNMTHPTPHEATHEVADTIKCQIPKPTFSNIFTKPGLKSNLNRPPPHMKGSNNKPFRRPKVRVAHGNVGG